MRIISSYLFAICTVACAEDLPALPEKSRLALSEDWSSGKIDPAKWYVL